MKYVEAVVMALIHNHAFRATKYVSEKETIRATMQRYRGQAVSAKPFNIRLHIGRPNYLERQFIKDCKRAGEKFPVKKIVLKSPPKRRA